jgi:hypothetical protein
MHRDFKGIWIEKEIWLITGLKPVYRVFLAEISSLDSGMGCFAKNQHFADMFGLSRNRCSEIITMLFDRGFIRIEIGETITSNSARIMRVCLPVDKSTVPVEKSTVPVEKSINIIGREIQREIHNNIGGKNILINDCIDILKNQVILLESAARRSGLIISDIKILIPVFVNHCAGIEKNHNNRSDYFQHFQNWVCMQPPIKNDLSVQLEWFIKKFNEVSGKQYKATKSINLLFSNQINEGFTGSEMLKAIINLYDGRNTWHKSNNYIEATPVFLLTGDRLNKFINVKY